MAEDARVIRILYEMKAGRLDIQSGLDAIKIIKGSAEEAAEAYDDLKKHMDELGGQGTGEVMARTLPPLEQLRKGTETTAENAHEATRSFRGMGDAVKALAGIVGIPLTLGAAIGKARELVDNFVKNGGLIDDTSRAWIVNNEKIEAGYQRIGRVVTKEVLPAAQIYGDVVQSIAGFVEQNPEVVPIGGAVLAVGGVAAGKAAIGAGKAAIQKLAGGAAEKVAQDSAAKAAVQAAGELAAGKVAGDAAKAATEKAAADAAKEAAAKATADAAKETAAKAAVQEAEKAAVTGGTRAAATEVVEGTAAKAAVQGAEKAAVQGATRTAAAEVIEGTAARTAVQGAAQVPIPAAEVIPTAIKPVTTATTPVGEIVPTAVKPAVATTAKAGEEAAAGAATKTAAGSLIKTLGAVIGGVFAGIDVNDILANMGLHSIQAKKGTYGYNVVEQAAQYIPGVAQIRAATGTQGEIGFEQFGKYLTVAAKAVGDMVGKGNEWAYAVGKWTNVIDENGQAMKDAYPLQKAGEGGAGGTKEPARAPLEQLQKMFEVRREEEEAQRQYTRQQFVANRNFQLQERYATEDYQKSVLRAHRDFNIQQSQALQDYNISRFRADRDFNRQLAYSEQDFYRQRRIAAREFGIQLVRSEQDYQISRQRASEDHQFQLYQIALSGDAMQYYLSERQYKIDQRRAEEDFNLRTKRSTEDFDRTQGDQEEQYNISRQRQLEQYEISRADQEQDFNIRRERAVLQFSITMGDQEIDFGIQRKRALEQFKISQDDMEYSFKEQTRLRRQALADWVTAQQQQNDLEAAYTELQLQFGQIAIDDFTTMMQNGKMYWDSLVDMSNPYIPGFQEGGYTEQGGPAILHPGEFVLNKETTTAVEGAAKGNRLTQENIVNMITGGSGGLTYQDNRRFDAKINDEDRRKLYEDTRDLLFELLPR